MRILLLCVAVLLLVGCEEIKKQTEGNRPPEAQKQQQKQSGISDAIDTVIIQRPKMESGRKAGQKIRKISAEKQKDLDAVLGD